jgi:hypothetical protein
MTGPERRGLQGLALWSPAKYGEWFSAYEHVGNLLRGRLPILPADEQVEAANVLLNHASVLIHIERLEEPVIKTLRN